jgi:hypothetical protein
MVVETMTIFQTPTMAGLLPAVSRDFDLVTSGRLSMAKILVISYTSPRGSK